MADKTGLGNYNGIEAEEYPWNQDLSDVEQSEELCMLWPNCCPESEIAEDHCGVTQRTSEVS